MRYLLLALTLASCTVAQDNGWMGVCDPYEPGYLTLDDECPGEIVWPRTPITIGGYHPDALDDAIDRWGSHLFETGADPVDSDVIGIREAGSDPLGSVRFLRMHSGRLRAELRIFNTASRAQEECVLFHELGHVLGLAHDDYGPMQPHGCDLCDPSDLTCDDGPSVVDNRITDGDRRRLDERYGE